jgi:uncharacterized protein
MTPEPVMLEEHRQILLQTAREAIRHGFEHADVLKLNPSDYPPELRMPAAVFVTLTREGELRGCIGTLESGRPLVENVAHYAHAAAFSDSRFASLTMEDWSELEIEISILSPLEPLRFTSEKDLLLQLRPGVDGLLLEEGGYRGTFLPSVWASLPEPVQFLRRLKRKAGLEADYWSDTLQVSRYTTFHLEGKAVPDSDLE